MRGAAACDGDGPRAPTGWGWGEAPALAGGWALALAVLLPPALPLPLPLTSESGAAPAAARLSLAAALAFWAVAVWILRSDLLHFTIPDEASAALAALGLAAAAGTAWLDGGTGSGVGVEGMGEAGAALRDAAATGAGAFALFWAVGASFRAAGRDALGHGDVKLAGALGVWLSPADAALALELAALGAVAGLLAPRLLPRLVPHGLRASRRATPLRDAAVPFGAFMAPAAWLVLVLAPGLRGLGLLPW